MIDEKRLQALLDLYKQQMQHYEHTQDLEWKGNFGVWTLLAATIYMVANGPLRLPHLSLCCAIIIALAIIATHGFWLYKVHDSEVWDKVFWTRYRSEALGLIRENAPLQDDEKPWNRKPHEKAYWLILEVMVTVLLCAFLIASLAARN